MNGREPPMVEMPPRYSFRLADLRTCTCAPGTWSKASIKIAGLIATLRGLGGDTPVPVWK